MISPETLRRYPFFARQSHYMLKEIAMLSKKRVLGEGDWLFYEGDPAFKLYIVLEGAISLTLSIYMNGDGSHIERMSPLGVGEVLGWSSLVKPFVYTLGAQATKKSVLAEIDAGPLRELLDDNPAYGYYMYKHLAEAMGERLTFKCIQLLSLILDAKGKPIKSTAKQQIE